MRKFSHERFDFNSERIGFDFDEIVKAVFSRLEKVSLIGPRFVFSNPIVIVHASYPSAEFFNFVRKRQGEWCSQANKIFGRRNFRSVAKFFTGSETSKYLKYYRRSAIYVGIYVADGELVPHHYWRTIESKYRTIEAGQPH